MRIYWRNLPINQSKKNNIIMIQFTINSFSNGISGRPYNSIKDAIQDGVGATIREQLSLYNDL
nr:MAG TPA: hypothetical protein [Caudoviricetes sp.]